MKQEQEKWNEIMSMDGTENAYVIHKELGEWMTDNVTVVRHNDKLVETDKKIVESWSAIKRSTSMTRRSGAIRVPCSRVSFGTCCSLPASSTMCLEPE